ncbi:MFS transporter, LPLT family, lysophospholipid transporter [Gammaproteobacteria bacterium]
MTRNVYILLIAQFLTAFADNAILFTALAMVKHINGNPPWYIPALQEVFLVAFVALAPWVGRFADARPKSVVLFNANVVKAIGAGLMFAGVDPLISYAIVGVGAAMYAPAKYGILPELVSHDALVKANGWIESTTILAILSGSIVGGMVADHSVVIALGLIETLFVLSAFTAWFIERIPPHIHERQKCESALPHFLHLAQSLLHTRRARFCVLGVAIFWAAAAALRVILVAWAPLVLDIQDSGGIAKLTAFIAIGIALGAVVVPHIVPLEHLRRARFAAYGVGIAILLLETISDIREARVVLILVGLAGGLFVVPINAALQEIGHRSVGSGNTIAVQQFFESLAMATATALYGLAAALGADPMSAIIVLGLVVIVVSSVVSWHLPRRRDNQ